MSILTEEEEAIIESYRTDIYSTDLVAIIDRLSAQVEELEGVLEEIAQIPQRTYSPNIFGAMWGLTANSLLCDCQYIARQALKKEIKL